VNYHNAKIEFQTQLLCEEIKKKTNCNWGQMDIVNCLRSKSKPTFCLGGQMDIVSC
jgi:hypothetical protein